MERRTDQDSRRQVVRYFAALILGSVFLLASWMAFKIGCEHTFVRHINAGYQGYLAEKPAPEVLFIGSSHTHMSYDIAAFEAATGRTAYALSYGSLDLNLMSLLLPDLLSDPGRRPDILVLEVYSAKIARQPDLEDSRLFFDIPPELKLKVLANYLHIHPDLPAYMDMFDLVVNRGTDQLFTFPVNNAMLARLSYKGAYRGHVNRGVSGSEFRTFQASIARSQPDPIQLAAFYRIIGLCRQYGIRLLLAESPMPQPISSKPEIQSLKRAIRDVAAANDLPYMDGDNGFPIDNPAMFHDASHLSTAGRSLYTANMISHFAPLLARTQELRSGRITGSTSP